MIISLKQADVINKYILHGNYASKIYNRCTKTRDRNTNIPLNKVIKLHRRNEKEKKRMKNYKNSWKTNNKMAIGTHLSITLLNVN